MHISDGVLELKVVVVVSLATALLFYPVYKTLKPKDLTLIAVASAMFFIASFVRIPLGVIQFHLLFIGIIGVLFGLRSFVAIFIALILQALILGFGGIANLGVNLFIMGVPAILMYYIFNMKIYKILNEKLGFFLVGFATSLVSTLFAMSVLYFAKAEYEIAVLAIFGINFAGMIVEGIISMFLLLFLKKVYPQILGR